MMTFLPAVVEAQYRGGYRIRLVFNDGAEGTISVRRWLTGPVFEALWDLDYFRRFYLDGGTVTWPNGVDIAPETLHAAVAGKPTRGPRSTRPKRRGTSPRRVSKP